MPKNSNLCRHYFKGGLQSLQKEQSEPCSFCTNKYLLEGNSKPGEVYTWEFQNTSNGYWYDVRDRAIEWIDGRIVRLEIATDITEKKNSEAEREQLISQLKHALDEIKTLRGLIPICSYCKKIRDVKGYWNQLESYISEHTEAKFSHGLCDECYKKEVEKLDILKRSK